MRPLQISKIGTDWNVEEEGSNAALYRD